MADCITYETYLRQQVDRGCYGVAVIPAVIALDIADYIEKRRQPTIEPEREKGKWRHFGDKEWLRDDGQPVFIICSECQNYVLNNASSNWNFCPNCGAAMIGEQDG